MSLVSTESIICFDLFRLYPKQRLLKENGEVLRIGGRALDILIELVRRQGEVLGKSELIKLVWADTIVEEDNLKVHVSALRRALGDGSGGRRYIVSVPGRGYAFVASVALESSDEAMPSEGQEERKHNLPALLNRLIGRSADIDRVVQQAGCSRLVTIVGPGGIGKTSVALAAAERLIPSFQYGVWLVDLAPITDERLVPQAVAVALGIETRDDNVLRAIANACRNKRRLLVLDNCEHVLGQVARVATALMQMLPQLQIVATSREPLFVKGEYLHHLRSLEWPASRERLTSADMQTFSATRLFVDRALDSFPEFNVSDTDASIVAEICAKLDGIPLAIEFAAANVRALGLHGLLSRLGDRLRLFSPRRHAALERHQTMRATHDWSYALLDHTEKTVLRRLACFSGYFTMQAASFVASTSDITPVDVVDVVARLVTKSLVSPDVRGTVARYRLLETTRSYALEKLNEDGEASHLSYRHATYFAEFLEIAWAEKRRLFAEGGYASIIDQLGNIRAALHWSFSTAGDLHLATKLVAGTGLYFVEVGLMTEARSWTGKALETLDETQRGGRHEMMLQYAYAHSMVITRGNTEDAARAVLRSIDLATALNDSDLQLRVLGGYHMFLSRSGDNKAAMNVALRAGDVAKATDDPDAIAMAEAMLGRSYHYAGELGKADACTRTVFEMAPLTHRINTIRFGNDHRVRALAGRASILWLIGRADQAKSAARELLAMAKRLADPIADVQAYYAAAILALQCGDWTRAGDLIGHLGQVAEEHAIAPFPALASSLEAELAYRTTAGEGAADRLRDRFDAVRASRYNPAFHGITVVESMAADGRQTEAAALIAELTTDMERKGQRVFLPEYFRLQGDILASVTGHQESDALWAYDRALKLARTQSSLAWELRTATSVARYYAHMDPRKAATILLPVYDRFSEGRDTLDLVSARTLLDTLTS